MDIEDRSSSNERRTMRSQAAIQALAFACITALLRWCSTDHCQAGWKISCGFPRPRTRQLLLPCFLAGSVVKHRDDPCAEYGQKRKAIEVFMSTVLNLCYCTMMRSSRGHSTRVPTSFNIYRSLPACASTSWHSTAEEGQKW